MNKKLKIGSYFTQMQSICFHATQYFLKVPINVIPWEFIIKKTGSTNSNTVMVKRERNKIKIPTYNPALYENNKKHTETNIHNKGSIIKKSNL